MSSDCVQNIVFFISAALQYDFEAYIKQFICMYIYDPVRMSSKEIT
jgi:hypothetical protein